MLAARLVAFIGILTQMYHEYQQLSVSLRLINNKQFMLNFSSVNRIMRRDFGSVKINTQTHLVEYALPIAFKTVSQPFS